MPLKPITALVLPPLCPAGAEASERIPRAWLVYPQPLTVDRVAMQWTLVTSLVAIAAAVARVAS